MTGGRWRVLAGGPGRPPLPEVLSAVLLAAGAAYLVQRSTRSSSRNAQTEDGEPTASASSSAVSVGSAAGPDAGAAQGSESEEAAERDDFLVRTDRLSLDREFGLGAVDGAWWPPTDVAPEAVQELVGALPEELGRVVRVSLPMADWSDDRQPRSVLVDGGRVHLGWFSSMQRHTARITFDAGEPLTVLVLPPDTGSGAASEVLSMVAEDRSRSELLSEAGSGSEDRPEERTDGTRSGGSR